MNRLILIGLLLVFASQLKLITHIEGNPLSGKTFTITSNAAKISELNVSFTDGILFFKDCNGHTTKYSV